MSEQKRPIEIVAEARDAAQEVIKEYDLEIGFALVITIPPGYDSVRFSTNIGSKGAATLLRETADRIDDQVNGTNIETP